jgi:hypothetical protein
VKELKAAHVRQLLGYLDERDHGEHSGWYCGNKEQFEKRHEFLRVYLEAVLDAKEAKK